MALFLEDWEIVLNFLGLFFFSYTEKFDKVMLDDVVVCVSDLPDAEVIVLCNLVLRFHQFKSCSR